MYVLSLGRAFWCDSSNGTTHHNMTSTKDSFPRRLFSLRHSATADTSETNTVYDRRRNSTDKGGRINFKKSITFGSFSSSGTAALAGVEIDSVTKHLSIVAAEESRNSFRGSLPQSLIAAHDSRDCVAPFRQEEVRYIELHSIRHMIAHASLSFQMPPRRLF